LTEVQDHPYGYTQENEQANDAFLHGNHLQQAFTSISPIKMYVKLSPLDVKSFFGPNFGFLQMSPSAEIPHPF
jgi:hypothetical protein